MSDPSGPSRPKFPSRTADGSPHDPGPPRSIQSGSESNQKESRRGRVLLVTRHFWPHAAGRHERAAEATWLSQLWAAQGLDVEVVTPRYGTDWSTQYALGEIHVHRFAAAPRGQWSSQRYVRHLGHWIREHSPRFDAVVSHTLGEDVPAVAFGVAGAGPAGGRRAGGKSTAAANRNEDATRSSAGVSSSEIGVTSGSRPTGWVIASGWGIDSDVQWCQQNRGGVRTLQAAQTLDGIITEAATTDRFLISSGIAPEKLIRLSRGYRRRTRFQLTTDSGDVAGPPSPSERKEVRRVLAATNRDLAAPDDTPVLLWCGAMTGRPDEPNRFPFLVRHARTLLNRRPDIRIWLLGDGELRDWAHTELKAEGVRAAVAMPGSFVDMTDVFAAVDVVVQTDEAQLRWTIPTAIEYGVPIILQDTPVVRGWLGGEGNVGGASEGRQAETLVNWYDPARPGSYHRAVQEIVDDLSAAYARAGDLCAMKAKTAARSEFANRWLTLTRRQSVVKTTDTNRSVS